MKRTLRRLALLSMAMVLCFASCEDPIIEDLVNTDLPTIITNEVSDITDKCAKTGGYISAQGGAEVVARGVCYSTTQNPTVGNSRTDDGQGLGGFTSILTELIPSTTYYIRAYATNQYGTAYGEERSFTTAEGTGDTGDTTQGEDGKPVVTTNQVVAIEYTSAICGGNVVSEELVLARGICWSTSPNPTINNTFTNEGQGAGNFTSRMTELSPNTTYYVRAYATNVNGTSYGEERTFTTNQYSLPIVITSNVTVSSTIAQCGGEVNFDGGLEVTGRGVCWSTSPNPTITNDKTTDGSGTGSFNSTIIGLSSNTTYYVRAYATNEIGTAYGEERSFTTEEDFQQPTVTTNSVSNITVNSAVCGGNVTSDGNATVTARGVCWSTSQNPTINDNKTIDGSGIGSFISNITELLEATTYYVRAYATNSQGTSYGTQYSFTTQATTGSINGHDWVDLGLPSGLKWATCNIGATRPELYGNYYAWGEITTKTEYTAENSLTYNQPLYDISGDVTYDAARANWGSTWRMPTKVELEELVNNCTFTWTTQSGVYGMIVTGPNGNSIFLPAAGGYRGSSLYFTGMFGLYFSSTPYESYRLDAYYLYLERDVSNVSHNCRYEGYTIRPVSD